jgi:hypothetical protein
MLGAASRESIMDVLPGKQVAERVSSASIVVSRQLGGKRIPLEPGNVWKIGRSDASDIVIADSAVREITLSYSVRQTGII